jgi:RNAse (barnase) inhibitor barstar
MTIVRIDTRRITDWDSFHTLFFEEFQFPDYYGRNMDAWIDCMSDIDLLTVIQLDHVDEFAMRCPELYDAILEATAFVNWRYVEGGVQPYLMLSFHRQPRR